MIIVDPVALGDVACTRASPKWVFDRTGTLVQVPVNTLAVTYDPVDLSKAPRALVEPVAIKCLAANDALETWPSYTTGTATASVQVLTDPGFGKYWRITKTAGAYGDRAGISMPLSGLSGTKYRASAYARRGTIGAAGAGLYVDGADGMAAWFSATGYFNSSLHSGLDWYHIDVQNNPSPNEGAGATLTGGGTAYIWVESDIGDYVDVRIPEIELGTKLTSPVIVAAGQAPYTRAADVIAPGAGLVYSNTPIDVQTYSAGATYAKDALVYDPVAHNVFQSLIASNVGKALSDTTAWTPRGAISRWAMFDQYNNTQTTNPDEILVVLSPQAISQGLYLGNLFDDEVRISVVDQVEGLVYSETANLVESNSGSSFFNWCFKRIKRRDYFLTLKLPVYANALVTISLRKIGGVAKCGMCSIGPTDDFGPTITGLSTEGKDYSSTTFNFDGTSSTVLRPYAKRMTCDVMVDNDQIDYLQARLFEIRQKPIVWVGGRYGSTAVYGRYESFKNVIPYATRSLMNLTIGGAI